MWHLEAFILCNKLKYDHVYVKVYTVSMLNNAREHNIDATVF